MQERCGGQQAFLGVLPADQRLGANDRTGAHVHLGLVVQHKLVPLQRALNVLQVFVVDAQVVVLQGIKHVVAVAPRQLGLVHGLVGLAQQLIGLDRLRLGVEGHAQAGRHLHRDVLHQNRLGGGLQQPGQQGQGGLRVGQISENSHKLVATNARHGVAIAQGILHVGGQGDQQPVAHIVAVVVVHALETIQVQVRHGQGVATPGGLGHGLVQAVCQQHPVGQVGQRIKMGNVLQLALVLFLRRDVGEQRHVML